MSPATSASADGDPAARSVVRVLPDVVGIDKEFDYLVPAGADVHVGDMVRIDLHGRRVGGWVTAVDVAPVPGVRLRSIAKVSGRGPSAGLIELAAWAAWRWAGRRPHLLRTASPPGVVRSLRREPVQPDGPGHPGVGVRGRPSGQGTGDPLGQTAAMPRPGQRWMAEALASDRAVLRLAPGADRYGLVRSAVDGAGTPGARRRAGTEADRGSGDEPGQTLVLCPSVVEAVALGRRLRADGIDTAVVASDRPGALGAGDWTRAASGEARVVVGARAAAWAPAPNLAQVVVLDEHDESYQQEQAPTWHARDVVAERARRAGAPCLLVSPCPTLEALAWGELVEVPRPDERAGWPRIEVVDQRDLDPALGPLFSPRLVDLVRTDGRVLCVLNRTGRARLLACRACSTLARCEVCDAAVSREDAVVGDDPPGPPDHGASELVCGRCGTRRPEVCLACGGTAFKNLRLGVSRAREELEALAGEPVGGVTASGVADGPDPDDARILIGTEAVLHRFARAEAVAFLDFDQELLSLRWRAAEEALALLARAARLVRRGSGPHGRILVQTRSPDHPALMAARHADPGRLVASERPLRQAFGLPPFAAVALVSGQAAEEFIANFGRPNDIAVQGPVDGTWRLRAATHDLLCDALAATERSPGRLRIEVDPLRS